jgi:hypothetical protein
MKPDQITASISRFDAALAAHRRAADRLTIEAAGLRALLAAPVERDPAADTLAQLREACEARGYPVSPDDHVAERDAGELLGRSQSTLRRWRAEGAGPPWRKRLNRTEYALAELAEFLADGTAEGD